MDAKRRSSDAPLKLKVDTSCSEADGRPSPLIDHNFIGAADNPQTSKPAPSRERVRSVSATATYIFFTAMSGSRRRQSLPQRLNSRAKLPSALLQRSVRFQV
jgi:hypothetical protein